MRNILHFSKITLYTFRLSEKLEHGKNVEKGYNQGEFNRYKKPYLLTQKQTKSSLSLFKIERMFKKAATKIIIEEKLPLEDMNSGK